MSVAYFDIFPGARFRICVDDGIIGVRPGDVRQLMYYLCTEATGNHAMCPKAIRVEHRALCKHVVVVVFEGLDRTRYERYGRFAKAFKELELEGFPVVVQAQTCNGKIVRGVETMFGHVVGERVEYTSYESMVPEREVLYDNGYPVNLECAPKLNRELRCSVYGMKALSAEELAGFGRLADGVEGALHVVALDCEMVETDRDDELVRMSVVNEAGDEVIDAYFRPVGEIVDLRTSKSGLTMEIIEEKARLAASECVTVLGKVADKHTIIIGHSLENDLRAMHLIHERVIDTSLIYSGEVPFPGKPSLAGLYRKYIKKPFRKGSGHDSTEDAKAALDLVKYALSPEFAKSASGRQTPELISDMLTCNSAVAVITAPDTSLAITRNQSDNLRLSIGKNTYEITQKTLEALEDAPPITIAYYDGLATCHATDEDQQRYLIMYNDALEKIKASLPEQSALIIYTGNGNLTRISHLTEGTTEFSLCREALLWIHTK